MTPQETTEAVNVSNSSQEVMEDDHELKQPPDTSADHQSVELSEADGDSVVHKITNLDNP